MKAFNRVWFVAAAIVVPTLLVFGAMRTALAGYVDEVVADDPAFWWRLDDPAGEDYAADSGIDFNDGICVDVTLGEPGLILTEPNSTAAGFDGVSSGVDIADFQGLNLVDNADPFVEKSILLWFNAEDAGNKWEQTIYQQGGSTRGLIVYIRDNQLYVGAWNNSDDDGAITSPWDRGPGSPIGSVFLSTPITSGETYQVGMVMEGDENGKSGTLTGYLNGQPFGEETGVGRLFQHTGDTSIGYFRNDTKFVSSNIGGEGGYFAGVIDEVALYNTALPGDRVLAQYTAAGGAGGGGSRLRAGDANMDFEFNQLDLVQVQIAAKYLTGADATWGEGDWDGAPGGEPGNPPAGNGKFDQLDIISALGAGIYLLGPYNAISRGGVPGDGQTSIVYNAGTGELAVDAPAGIELTSINIDSAASMFTGDPAQNLGGSFDNDADNNIFKATFGSSFGSLTFGNVAPPGLSEEFVLGDLTVVGSLAGGGDLGNVDLIYVPEPSTVLLALLGTLVAFASRRRGSVISE